MALVLKDRVLESSTSSGTGSFTLSGAQTGYQSFSVIGNGNTVYYTIQGKNSDGTLTDEWEVGVGTWSTGGTLARDTVLESSNSNALVNFSIGLKDVFCDLPAEKVITTASTGLSISGNTITNTAPDQTVVLTGAGLTSVTGTYPNFTISSSGGAGGGDVTGPSSATDNAITRFDGTTGKLIQSSPVTIDDAGNIIGADSVQFSGTVPTSTSTPGIMWFDNSTDTLNFQQNNITQQIGEELFIYGRATAAITDGQVIALTGAYGTTGVVTFAPAPIGTSNADLIIGVATEPIANNAFGRITVFGTVHGLDTASLSIGATLYYDPTVVGGYTTTIPTAPNIKVQIGTVTKAAGGTNGSINVGIAHGETLNILSDVQITSATGGQLLTYNQTGGYWKNTSLTAGTGISVSAATGGGLTVTNSAPDQTVAITGAGGATVTGTYPNFTITTPSGTVTSASVVSANGFAGTVANASTTPAITLSTTITGLLKGNGTAISAAASGTDYAPATSGTSILYGNGAGGFSNVTVGSGLSFSTGTLSATGGSMVYPGAGIAVSTGSAWTTSLTAPSGAIVGTTDTQTLSGKTITGTKETVYTITDGAAFEIDPANGGIQTITLTASRTPAATNFTAGQSVTLMINDGTAYTITWTTVGVVWVGGSAPTLATTGYTVIELWKVGSTIYGAYVGAVA